MKAQLYTISKSSEPDDLRLFSSQDRVADLPVEDSTTQAADVALRRLHLRRKTKWKTTEWGYEAEVGFL